MGDGRYTITLDHERGLVRVAAVGEFVRNRGDELITHASLKAAEHRYNILCDVRSANAKVSLADWFFLPRRLAVYRDVKTRSISTALVVAAGRQERGYRFFETVTSNLGMNIRVFLDEKDALAWLAGVI